MQITRQDLESRFSALGRDQYLFLYSVMKGVSFANGAYVLSLLLQDLEENWLRLPLWIASICALLVTYSTAFKGNLFLGPRTNLVDIFAPLILSLAEFLLFSVLQPPSPPLGADPNSWNPDLLGTKWYFLFSIFSAAAWITIWNRWREFREEDYDADVCRITHKYKDSLLVNLRESAYSTIGFISVFVLLAFVLVPNCFAIEVYHPLFGVVVTGFMMIVLRRAEADQNRIVTLLFDGPESSNPGVSSDRSD